MIAENKLKSIFSDLKDHRMDRTKLHPMENIIFISMAAVICGAETWEEIEEFGEAKKIWFSTFLNLENGVPSHDTFNRFFSILDPIAFETCFRNWVTSLAIKLKGDVVSIDGKTVRGSKGFGQSAIHIVSAWSHINHISLGQLKTAQKSNEITAIPELLDALFLEGCTVTIDAMGCQTDIANKIISKNANYILAVKENQSDLCEGISDSFRFLKHESIWEDEDFGHGRIEKRTCSVISNLEMIEKKESWKELKTIVRIESERYMKISGITEKSTRYYITSLAPNPEEIGAAIRAHWGIENNLHWMLDVAFGEDRSRKRMENAPLNFSLINKIALTFLKNDKTTKIGIKSKRLKAGWREDYLMHLLSN